MNEFQSQLLAHTPELIRYTSALTGDLPSAEAMTEECLKEAISKHDEWDKEKKMKLWLMTITHNVYLKWLQENKKPHISNLKNYNRKMISDYSKVTPFILQNLQKSLQLLPSEQREVLLMVCLVGLDYKEVGIITETKLTTVMSRLHRARKRLGDFIFPQDVDKVESI